MSGAWEETEETGMGFAMWRRGVGRVKKKDSAICIVKLFLVYPY
jgi:hypothetical protein